MKSLKVLAILLASMLVSINTEKIQAPKIGAVGTGLLAGGATLGVGSLAIFAHEYYKAYQLVSGTPEYTKLLRSQDRIAMVLSKISESNKELKEQLKKENKSILRHPLILKIAGLVAATAVVGGVAGGAKHYYDSKKKPDAPVVDPVGSEESGGAVPGGDGSLGGKPDGDDEDDASDEEYEEEEENEEEYPEDEEEATKNLSFLEEFPHEYYCEQSKYYGETDNRRVSWKITEEIEQLSGELNKVSRQISKTKTTTPNDVVMQLQNRSRKLSNQIRKLRASNLANECIRKDDSCCWDIPESEAVQNLSYDNQIKKSSEIQRRLAQGLTYDQKTKLNERITTIEQSSGSNLAELENSINRGKPLSLDDIDTLESIYAKQQQREQWLRLLAGDIRDQRTAEDVLKENHLNPDSFNLNDQQIALQPQHLENEIFDLETQISDLNDQVDHYSKISDQQYENGCTLKNNDDNAFILSRESAKHAIDLLRQMKQLKQQLEQKKSEQLLKTFVQPEQAESDEDYLYPNFLATVRSENPVNDGEGFFDQKSSSSGAESRKNQLIIQTNVVANHEDRLQELNAQLIAALDQQQQPQTPGRSTNQPPLKPGEARVNESFTMVETSPTPSPTETPGNNQQTHDETQLFSTPRTTPRSNTKTPGNNQSSSHSTLVVDGDSIVVNNKQSERPGQQGSTSSSVTPDQRPQDPEKKNSQPKKPDSNIDRPTVQIAI